MVKYRKNKMKRGERMNSGINVGALIFQLIAIAIPIIFIVILSTFWSTPKKKNAQSNHIDKKFTAMEKKIKKWIDYRN